MRLISDITTSGCAALELGLELGLEVPAVRVRARVEARAVMFMVRVEAHAIGVIRLWLKRALLRT